MKIYAWLIAWQSGEAAVASLCAARLARAAVPAEDSPRFVTHQGAKYRVFSDVFPSFENSLINVSAGLRRFRVSAARAARARSVRVMRVA